MTLVRPSSLLLLSLMACAFLLLLGMAAPVIREALGSIPMDIPVKVPPLTRGELATLPLTNHAKAGHPERSMGAEAIREVMMAGRCNPIDLYFCPATDTLVVTCPALNDRTVLSLWVGATDKAVVTGYPMDASRLDKNVSGCIGPMPLP